MGVYIHDLNLQKPNLLDGPHVYSAYILVKPGERSVIVVDNEDGESSEKYEIITVPPHGRLGDLDALAEKAIRRSEKCGVSVNVLDKDITAYDIETAPTVIPAEEAQP